MSIGKSFAVSGHRVGDNLVLDSIEIKEFTHDKNDFKTMSIARNPSMNEFRVVISYPESLLEEAQKLSLESLRKELENVVNSTYGTAFGVKIPSPIPHQTKKKVSEE